MCSFPRSSLLSPAAWPISGDSRTCAEHHCIDLGSRLALHQAAACLSGLVNPTCYYHIVTPKPDKTTMALEARIRRVPANLDGAGGLQWHRFALAETPAAKPLQACRQVTAGSVSQITSLFPLNSPIPIGCHMSPGSCPLTSPYQQGRHGTARHGTAGEPKRAAGRAGGKTCISDSQTKISSHVSTRLSIVPETTPPLPNTNKNPQNLILWDSNHTAFMEK